MRSLFLLAWLILAPAYWQASSSTPPKQPTAASTTASAQKEATENSPTEPFWQRTTSDPVALYTLVLAIFTGLLVIVSTVQGAFLLRADKTARIAANAAAESASVARDTLHLGQRAHLHLSTWRIDNFEPHKVPVVQLEILNEGNTAAELVGFRSAYDIVDPPTPTPEYPEPAQAKHGLVRPSDEAFTVLSFEFASPLSPQDFQAAVTQKRAIYIWGEIIYKDIFADEHRTGFGYEMWIARTPQGGWNSFPIDKPGYNYAD